MRISDPTINPVISPTNCEYGQIIAAVVMVVVGVTTSLISASQQAKAANAAASAQNQEAENARAIAQYNANIQRQNNDVALQLAQYQSTANAQMSQLNEAAALNNAALAQVQQQGAQMQYQQGLQNAEQQRLEAEAARAQGREEVNRKREENDQRMALIRSKYAASGVTQEGSPLEVLGDAARLGEVAVQDVAYTAELTSRKDLREAEIEKFKAGFSLIDEMGFGVEAANYKLQAQAAGYQTDLYEYDSAIAGAKYRIGLNEARLTELSGEAQAYGYEAEAQQSKYKAQGAILGGWLGAANAVASGVGSLAGSYGGGGFGGGSGGYQANYGSSFAAAKIGTGSSASSNYFRWTG